MGLEDGLERVEPGAMQPGGGGSSTEGPGPSLEGRIRNAQPPGEAAPPPTKNSDANTLKAELQGRRSPPLTPAELAEARIRSADPFTPAVETTPDATGE